MRQTFIPLFQDIRTSSLWVLDQATPGCLRVFITLLTLTDAKGYVCASLPGIAAAACLPIEMVARCIEVFESPDPYSRTRDHEGRRIEKVDRGWRLLTYEAMVERARHESRKASKRRWARDNYEPANDNANEPDEARPANDTLPPVEAQPTSIPRPDSSNLDPSRSRSRSFSSEGEADPPNPPLLPVVLRSIPEDWEPSDELMAEGIAQLGREGFDRRISELREKPIGGVSGVLSHKLEGYVRRLIPKWRTWAETDRAKAQRAAQAPRGGPSGGRYVSPTLLEPNAKHRAFAARHGIDLDAELRRLNEGGIVEALGLTGARQNLEAALTRLAKERQRGASF